MLNKDLDWVKYEERANDLLKKWNEKEELNKEDLKKN